MEDLRQSHSDSTIGYFNRVPVLVFRSGGIVFGADIEDIVEILDDESSEIEELPDTPGLMRHDLVGFTTFRENELAVISFNQQFSLTISLDNSMDDQNDQVIVVKNDYGYLGIQVDQIDNIINLEIEHIDPIPDFVESLLEVESLWGMGKASKPTNMLSVNEDGIGDVIMLVELNDILPDDQKRLIQTTTYSKLKNMSETSTPNLTSEP
ncbi:TPA: chemotaxis protein CheW [Candidatus Poribacteria bacterium]|nr:chemotaxis protein CheW [Candidatus Poribacteria bacterium]HIB85967.1 chemotaxis protein CheW [Candidatus Poribacteria bacterium]HIB99836.1 chemotaxis protein CheW [Candidatus Poribacteria bacterium]HIO79696.1 chemotaxis protein CheW [Candidatus Poribacteria bacterium]